MFRVTSQDVLVVPPFEAAWLSLADYGIEGGCCLVFDYKGARAVGRRRAGARAAAAPGALGAEAALALRRAPLQPLPRSSCCATPT